VPLILFGLFIIIPVLEIAAFIQVGSIIGLPLTLLGILFTALLGAFLVRQQGFKALNDAKANLENQKSPAEQMIHGIFILIAGLLLLTPGFLTDTIGFLFLIPPLRLSIAKKVWSWMKTNDSFTINTPGGMGGGGPNGFEKNNSDSNKTNRYDADQFKKRNNDIIDGEAVEIINDNNLENK